MKSKKIMILGLSLAVALGAFGCTSRNDTTKDNKTTNTTGTTDTTGTSSDYTNTDYAKTYASLYDTNISPLTQYSMYSDVNATTNAYANDSDYPGNEEYVKQLRAAYQDSRDNLQTFVNGLQNDAKTDDSTLKADNDKLISQGNQLIGEIDTKIKNLDNIPKDAYSKSKNDFINVVNDTTAVDDTIVTDFNDMIKNMNEMLGIKNNSDTTNTNKDTNK